MYAIEPILFVSVVEGGAPQSSALMTVLLERVKADPFHMVASVVFLLAILHTFFTSKILHLAHIVEEAHLEKARSQPSSLRPDGRPKEVSFGGQMLHFLGEIEAVFGIWVVVLALCMISMKGWQATVDYMGHQVNFTEPMFVVVIMALASTRPVLKVAEALLRSIASMGRGSVGAWWLTILTVASILGSLITEPAAMTIAALLLSRQFYAFEPSPKLAYATLGLLFVNVSIGGTLTHFAAPPVLMVAGPWKWNTAHMFMNFGWKAVIAILISTFLVYLAFRGEFSRMENKRRGLGAAEKSESRAIPVWVVLVQLGFMAWTVFMAHYPVFFIGGFLFFLAFAQATAHHQRPVDLRAPLLVGFFLAGLVIHGGLQGWWIEPVLKSLEPLPLYFGALTLTAFNDNAAITYLATLVPDFSDPMKYAVVAGAVAGGGLTVIANAPNPAGQSILKKHFANGIAPLGLLLGALVPTVVVSLCFLLL